jgi:hypothetical protein
MLIGALNFLAARFNIKIAKKPVFSVSMKTWMSAKCLAAEIVDKYRYANEYQHEWVFSIRALIS